MLHSTGQLYSHKRKHERRDFEHAYRRFKDEQKRKVPPSMMASPGPNPRLAMSPGNISMATSPGMIGRPVKQEAEYIDLEDLSKFEQSNVSSENSMGPTDLSMSSASSTATNPDIKCEFGSSVTSTPERAASHTGPVTPSTFDAREEGNVKQIPATLSQLASKLASSSSLNESLTLPIPGSSEDKPPEGASNEHPQDSQSDTSRHSPVPGAVNLSSSPSITSFVPKISPPVNEKKEKDESWKKYLTR